MRSWVDVPYSRFLVVQERGLPLPEVGCFRTTVLNTRCCLYLSSAALFRQVIRVLHDGDEEQRWFTDSITLPIMLTVKVPALKWMLSCLFSIGRHPARILWCQQRLGSRILCIVEEFPILSCPSCCSDFRLPTCRNSKSSLILGRTSSILRTSRAACLCPPTRSLMMMRRDASGTHSWPKSSRAEEMCCLIVAGSCEEVIPGLSLELQSRISLEVFDSPCWRFSTHLPSALTSSFLQDTILSRRKRTLLFDGALPRVSLPNSPLPTCLF